MKRIVYFAVTLAVMSMIAFSGAAFARDNKIRVSGTIESIDQTGFTFVLTQQDGVKTRFNVDARSEFEIERRDVKHDVDVPFTDLKVGDNVRVKAYPGLPQQNPLADDVKIYR